MTQRPFIYSLFILAILSVYPVHSNSATLPIKYPAKLLDVTDGDTIKVRATIWIKTFMDTNVRIYGIDTPELSGKCDNERYLAQQAKKFVEETLGSATEIYLDGITNDKYGGRVVSTVLYKNPKGKTRNIAKDLIKQGLAVPYDGGTKTHNWCKEK